MEERAPVPTLLLPTPPVDSNNTNCNSKLVTTTVLMIQTATKTSGELVELIIIGTSRLGTAI